MKEEWRPIPGYEGYEASNNGRIRSIPTERTRGRILKTQINNWGYEQLSLRRNGRLPGAMVHRLVALAFGIIGPLDQTDHINRDKLNNRLENLRSASASQQIANSKKPIGGTSRYKGVSWQKHARKWGVRIKAKGQESWLGYFKNEEDAAKAYDKAAMKLFGEYALLNFPNRPPGATP